MKRSDLLDFMRQEKYAVEATSASAGPQAAVIGIVVSDAFEIFFDTLDTTRKARNLRLDPKVAFVVGGTGQKSERTVQYQGLVDEPTGADLTRLKQLYFSRFPDGPSRERWEGITYFRARPTWLRYSDYTRAPPLIVEFSAPDLANLR